MKNVFILSFLITGVFITSCRSRKKSYSKAEVLCNSFALVQEKMKLRREPYPIYSEKIKCEDVEDDRIFYYVYDDITYEIKVSRKYYSDYLALFEKGILHPNLIGVCFFF